MSLEKMRTPLRELLELVVAEPGDDPGDDKRRKGPGFASTIPSDIGEVEGRTLWLTDHAARQYRNCLRGFLSEGENGDLEHLAQRDIEKSLWRLVCETWLEREAIRPNQRAIKVDDFVSSLRRPPEGWEVLWEINDLDAEESFEVADVDFFRFEGAAPEGHLWREVEKELLGRTFARAMVYAGSKDKALDRAKAAIDDALNILRVSLIPHRQVYDLQLLQRRGMHFYAGRTSGSFPEHSGAQWGFGPFPLEISSDLIDFLNKRNLELHLGLNKETPSRLREPILRALYWIGSSVTRQDLDDRVVDLCTALECLLGLENDKRKAEAISVRYMLMGLAAKDTSYVVHPLAIYHLYLLRNDIVHGSARRVSSKQDYKDLRYVALDAVQRISKVVADQPRINRLSRLFDHIKTEPELAHIVEFISRYSSSDQAVRDVKTLAEKWLEEVRTAESK
jgi:Apea-like HEPN